jgi:hypothetical protein
MNNSPARRGAPPFCLQEGNMSDYSQIYRFALDSSDFEA